MQESHVAVETGDTGYMIRTLRPDTQLHETRIDHGYTKMQKQVLAFALIFTSGQLNTYTSPPHPSLIAETGKVEYTCF